MRVLLITTRWLANSHRFLLNEDGLVEYHEECIQPYECATRFVRDYEGIFDVLRAAVNERTVSDNIDKPYRWEESERFI
jgi:hypothetical protein